MVWQESVVLTEPTGSKLKGAVCQNTLNPMVEGRKIECRLIHLTVIHITVSFNMCF